VFVCFALPLFLYYLAVSVGLFTFFDVFICSDCLFLFACSYPSSAHPYLFLCVGFNLFIFLFLFIYLFFVLFTAIYSLLFSLCRVRFFYTSFCFLVLKLKCFCLELPYNAPRISFLIIIIQLILLP